ncbi:MAG: tripartite tricarboxylate transporter permease [Beijerinckiaceae bacterium]|nr:tripartite tricarboxylate transporter permease [Beijerinckiaceae bacterium]
MDVSMLDAAGKAFVLLFDPFRLMLLALGCVMGLVLGILPGIGGLAGTALLLPFTFNMDPYAAMALLLGLGATTATGDPIPAILFGVPGGAGSAATVLDGLPLAKRGEASRALSAAYMSSMMGGIFGAALMAVLLPVLRPMMLYIGSPELLAFAVLGISMVAVLSGSAPLRGLAAGCIGLMISMVGSDPQTGTLRWTLDSLYLWEGAPLVPIVLGLFALPELCDLAISRTSIAPGSKQLSTSTAGMIQGARDCFTHWWLVVRCSWLGAALGAVPGIGGAIVDWLAYGHALKTEKGAASTFGRGDIRGVIASESSNNAKEGGALIPTVAFGVPGSAGMAILLGAFLIHGLVPGPDMLTKNLSVTYAMVWSVALANVLGAGLCYLFSSQFARLATLRYTLILPATLSIIYIGAFQGSRNWGDLYTLLAFGVLGWTMKMLKWPRPPLLLGCVLGEIVERYLFISIQRYGVDWFARPIVVVIFAVAFVGLLRPFLQDVKIHGGLKRMLTDFQMKPNFKLDQLFYLFLFAVLGYMMLEASTWNFSAKIVPMIVGSIAAVCMTISLFNYMFRRPAAQVDVGLAGETVHEIESKIHMDLDSGTDDIPMPVILRRAAVFFGWLIAFMASMATIGLIPTVPIFVIAFMRLEETKERWSLVIPQAVILTIFVYILFDQLLTIPWPPTLVGGWFPALKGLIPSV